MNWYTTLLFLGGIYPAQVFSPKSAGRHLSHNKPANRVFLLPRRPCISTGVNSGYTVRTRFYFLGNVCNHCTLYLLAIGL